MLLPFYVRFNSFNDVIVCKDFFLIALTFISVCLFGFAKDIGPELKLPFISILILSWFNHKDFYQTAAIHQTMCFSAGILLVYHLISWAEHLDRGILLNCFRITAILESLVFVLNRFGINPYNIHADKIDIQVVGSLGQQTLSGALIAALAPTMLSGWGIWCLPLIIYAVYLSGSAMTAVSFVFGILICLFYKIMSKRYFWIVISSFGAALLGAFIFGLNTVSFFSNHGRFAVWKLSTLFYLRLWTAREMMFGKGLGFLSSHLDIFQYNIYKFTHAHNEYIEILWAFGLVGILLFWMILKPLLKTHKKDSVFLGIIGALAVNSIGNFTMHVSSIAIIGLISYAYIIGRNNNLTGG